MPKTLFPQIDDPDTTELLTFLVEEWQTQQHQIDTLVKILKHQRKQIRSAHDELAWLDMALRDHFPHWFESGEEDE